MVPAPSWLTLMQVMTMTELRNTIAPRQVAVALILRAARDARADADAAGLGTDVWLFHMRLAELLDSAAQTVADVIDPLG